MVRKKETGRAAEAKGREKIWTKRQWMAKEARVVVGMRHNRTRPDHRCLQSLANRELIVVEGGGGRRALRACVRTFRGNVSGRPIMVGAFGS